jgi:hypothetical protein
LLKSNFPQADDLSASRTAKIIFALANAFEEKRFLTQNFKRPSHIVCLRDQILRMVIMRLDVWAFRVSTCYVRWPGKTLGVGRVN